MTAFTRAHPSPRYTDLLRMYRELHEEGEKHIGTRPEETFPGGSLGPHVWRVKRLVEHTGAQNVLDYGCGKAMLYDVRNIKLPDGGTVECIQDFWDVDFIHCYDPAYKPFSKLPDGRFDGVVCTDVMEHCPEEDLQWILGEIFGYAEKFVFLTIASYPAKKRLPNGENAHITIRPAEWWDALIRRVAATRPELVWHAQVESYTEVSKGVFAPREQTLGTFETVA
jgi:hypothetical protein